MLIGPFVNPWLFGFQGVVLADIVKEGSIDTASLQKMREKPAQLLSNMLAAASAAGVKKDQLLCYVCNSNLWIDPFCGLCDTRPTRHAVGRIYHYWALLTGNSLTLLTGT